MKAIGHCLKETPGIILHYVGGKPWVPIRQKMTWDSHFNYILLERLWWQVFFNDKTVVVASGPSMKRDPIGPYIDMFQNVIRINNYELNDPEHIGTKTTHVMLHKATRPAHYAAVNSSNVLFLAFQDTGNLAKLQRQMDHRAKGAYLDLHAMTMVDEWYWTGLNREADSVAAQSAVAPMKEGKHLLTDTIAVAWAVRELSKWQPVYVVGFDMMLQNMSEYEKTWGNRHSDLWNDLKHDHMYLSSLLSLGRVKQQ